MAVGHAACRRYHLYGSSWRSSSGGDLGALGILINPAAHETRNNATNTLLCLFTAAGPHGGPHITIGNLASNAN